MSQYEDTDLAPNAIQAQNYLNIKSVPQLFEALKNPENKDLEIEASVLFVEKGTGKATIKKLNRQQFVETYKKNDKRKTFRESIDYFATDLDFSTNQVGSDFIPLMGGPFNKQLYLYDYLKMHAVAFHAYNHDPIGRAAIQIIRDFVIGRGWRVDSDNPAALALWRAFEEANNLRTMIDQFCMELSIYGEQMVWWLPKGETKIGYQLRPGQQPPKGILPRVRLIDPSVIWEIVTYPEDITRVLYYQWVAPTQYQMYTGRDKGEPVPGTKFIFQQIPAESVDHYKINSVSNEKRGRSDLFPVLGYMKRLRDSVNYSIIGLQKSTAWSIDTTIDGIQADLDAYIKSQEELGTIPPPGSEFVHSKKVERKYMSNEGSAKGQQSSAFDWTFSMICAGLGIPLNYFGTHLSGGQTRASAIVATEPVAKKFEARRQIVENCLHKMAKRLFAEFGIDAEIEVSFPELITQDRTAKLKDLAMAEQLGWISKERAAEIAAKEFDITKYDYLTEQQRIKAAGQDQAPVADGEASPLTAPPGVQGNDVRADKYAKPANAITGQDRRDIKATYGN
jgi:hypothetical protein